MLLHRIAATTCQTVETLRHTMPADSVEKWRLYFDHHDIDAIRHAELLAHLLNAQLRPKRNDMFKLKDFYPTLEQ